METIILELFFYFGLSVLFNVSEPAIYFKRFIGFKEENYDSYTPLKRFIHRGLHCLFCSALWVTLLASQSFTTAVIVATIAYLYDNHK